jgi:integrase/recombinase XerD
LGTVFADDLSQEDILKYQRKRREEGVSNGTINKEVYTISGLLKWASDPENAIIRPRYWKIQRLPHPRRIPNVLTPEEVSLILKAAEPLYQALLCLCLYGLGLRANEARMLKWSNIDRKNNLITVMQKGGSFKQLPLSPMLLSAFDAIPGDRTEFVFANPKTKKPLIDFRTGLDRACKAAGLTRHVNPHLFRHSVATHLMRGDINLRIIQQYLGHADISTTQFYTHVRQQHLKGVSAMIEAGLHKPLTTPGLIQGGKEGC